MATTRQKKFRDKLVENGGDATKALIQSGYSPNTAHTPSKVTKSKGFLELLEQMGITDEKLSKVLDEGLGATKAVVMGVKSDESFVDIQPDYAIRHKYLETGLKLKGYNKDDVISITNNNLQVIMHDQARNEDAFNKQDS